MQYTEDEKRAGIGLAIQGEKENTEKSDEGPKYNWNQIRHSAESPGATRTGKARLIEGIYNNTKNCSSEGRFHHRELPDETEVFARS